MGGLPLTLRDFLAYTTSGAVATIAVLVAISGGVDVDASYGVHIVTAFVVLCYVVGHMLGTTSASLVRRAKVHTRSHTSLRALLTDEPKPQTSPGKPLPAVVRSRVRKAAACYDIELPGDEEAVRALGLVAEAVVREVHGKSTRVDRWGTLYDFSRNIAAALIVAAVALAAGGAWHREAELALASTTCAGMSVPFMFRYLHFFTFYQRSLVTAFTELTLAGAAPPPATDDSIEERARQGSNLRPSA